MAAYSIATGHRRRALAAVAHTDTKRAEGRRSAPGDNTRQAVAATPTTAIIAPVANAFGHTFFLAPTFCFHAGREDALHLPAYVKADGLAIMIKSQMQPSQRLVELVAAGMASGIESADALALGADALLGADACRMLNDPNAGGASRISEALSIEVLSRAFGFSLKQTEMEINYWPPHGSITDFSVTVEGGTTVGVSVTRAVSAPGKAFTVEQATALLTKKLGGVLQSTANACGEWAKQILHIWCPDARAVEKLEEAYDAVSEALRADTVVLVSLCDGLDVLFAEKSSSASPPRLKKALKGAKDEAHLRHLTESDPVTGALTSCCRGLLQKENDEARQNLCANDIGD